MRTPNSSPTDQLALIGSLQEAWQEIARIPRQHAKLICRRIDFAKRQEIGDIDRRPVFSDSGVDFRGSPNTWRFLVEMARECPHDPTLARPAVRFVVSEKQALFLFAEDSTDIGADVFDLLDRSGRILQRISPPNVSPETLAIADPATRWLAAVFDLATLHNGNNGWPAVPPVPRDDAQPAGSIIVEIDDVAAVAWLVTIELFSPHAFANPPETRRGRKRRYDPAKDAHTANVVAQNIGSRYEAARVLGMKPSDVDKALDRHQKRQRRASE